MARRKEGKKENGVRSKEKWRNKVEILRVTSLESRRQRAWLHYRARSCHGARLSKSRKEKKERRGSEWRVNQNKTKEKHQNEASQTKISPSSHRCHTSQLASWCRASREEAELQKAQIIKEWGENPGSIFEIPRQGTNPAEVSCMSLRGQWKEVWR